MPSHRTQNNGNQTPYPNRYTITETARKIETETMAHILQENEIQQIDTTKNKTEKTP
jgi:hypothetical protein